ncbi:hypothetical protein EPO44_15620 [bacterium]|nr:MAG: hypothetical protein EPO44_15620 [bacterium]
MDSAFFIIETSPLLNRVNNSTSKTASQKEFLMNRAIPFEHYSQNDKRASPEGEGFPPSPKGTLKELRCARLPLIDRAISKVISVRQIILGEAICYAYHLADKDQIRFISPSQVILHRHLESERIG